MAELSKKGYQAEDVHGALMQADDFGQGDFNSPDAGYNQGFASRNGSMGAQGYSSGMQGMPMQQQQEMPRMSKQAGSSSDESNIYERIEEIVEGMIDEKWDELISEVKKIIQWKDGVEEKQAKLANDVEKLKEDFKVLHEGVLGKLEDYDTRMRDVGTELKAVGKVFKDVIPEFVENVKELKGIKESWKK
ncbi:hypothetical protein HYT52_00265 [Candidatus Woesearchaeota archaeon]|nr:hypothetical protein [Candidatus Woesearchaeota archaeon]